MPTATYEQLLIEIVPQVIETGKQYREVGSRFGELIGKARKGCRRKRARPPSALRSCWSTPARRPPT